MKIQILNPGPNNSLLNEMGEKVSPPTGWAFLPAGDAGITRKVTTHGVFWRVQFKKGRRMISKGIWAPREMIERAIMEVEATRKTDSYQQKRVADRKRRSKKQEEYELAFQKEVEKYLHFHPKYRSLEKQMAMAITQHAIPIGSGTVARTAMIPLEERAAKAVIAWMRHQTTAYDQLSIARIKGQRRQVRRMLAQESLQVLEKYRKGHPITELCPLSKSLNNYQ